MKKIRSFSLFLALLLLFSFTSCENESGEITTEYIKTLDTEVITDTTSITEPETEAQTEPEDNEEETNSPVTNFAIKTENFGAFYRTCPHAKEKQIPSGICFFFVLPRRN